MYLRGEVREFRSKDQRLLGDVGLAVGLGGFGAKRFLGVLDHFLNFGGRLLELADPFAQGAADFRQLANAKDDDDDDEDDEDLGQPYSRASDEGAQGHIFVPLEERSVNQ